METKVTEADPKDADPKEATESEAKTESEENDETDTEDNDDPENDSESEDENEVMESDPSSPEEKQEGKFSLIIFPLSICLLGGAKGPTDCTNFLPEAIRN